MTAYIQLSTWISRETDKAIAVEYSNGRAGSAGTSLAWFPKSKTIISHPEDFADPNRMLILAPVWAIPNHISKYEYNRFSGYQGIVER